jgi:sterol desaturase/sphingolipid hydroxylase (fatty acid hydroxylase superfamily)
MMIAGFLTGLLTANIAEWHIHKYWLHQDAKRKHSFWRFHWAEHHKHVIRDQYRDNAYEKNLFEEWNAQSKEAAALLAGALTTLPFAIISPGYTAGVWSYAAYYYYVHKKSHLDPEWGYKYLPWHYDHHMGPDQDQNWNVVFPLWDYVMGTRKPYAGTEREAKDIAKGRRIPPAMNKPGGSANLKVA